MNKEFLETSFLYCYLYYRVYLLVKETLKIKVTKEIYEYIENNKDKIITSTEVYKELLNIFLKLLFEFYDNNKRFWPDLDWKELLVWFENFVFPNDYIIEINRVNSDFHNYYREIESWYSEFKLTDEYKRLLSPLKSSIFEKSDRKIWIETKLIDDQIYKISKFHTRDSDFEKIQPYLPENLKIKNMALKLWRIRKSELKYGHILKNHIIRLKIDIDEGEKYPFIKYGPDNIVKIVNLLPPDYHKFINGVDIPEIKIIGTENDKLLGKIINRNLVKNFEVNQILEKQLIIKDENGRPYIKLQKIRIYLKINNPKYEYFYGYSYPDIKIKKVLNHNQYEGEII